MAPDATPPGLQRLVLRRPPPWSQKQTVVANKPAPVAWRLANAKMRAIQLTNIELAVQMRIRTLEARLHEVAGEAERLKMRLDRGRRMAASVKRALDDLQATVRKLEAEAQKGK